MNGEQIGGIVRAVVSAIGGFFVGKGVLDAETATALAGAAATIGAAVWSVLAKKKAEPQA